MPFFSLTELFPADVVERAAEKSSQVLYDETVRKVVTMVRKLFQPAKHIQFSQVSRNS